MKFFVSHFKLLFQYDNEENDLSRCSNESEEDNEGEVPVEELFKKPKKGKKGRRGQWTEHLTDDKYKEKLSLTNVKNVKNGQCHDNVIEELQRKRG